MRNQTNHKKETPPNRRRRTGDAITGVVLERKDTKNILNSRRNGY